MFRRLGSIRSTAAACAGLLACGHIHAQFYNGSQQEFGKSRVQFQDFLWQYYRFDRMETYFYKGGRDVARYVAMSAHRHMEELEKEFDFTVDDRLQFIVYNSLTDFRQSNIGVTGDEEYNIGGVTRIVGTKIFVYNEGDRALLDRQVRTGIAQVLLDQMMYGGNWKEVLKNSTLLNLPEWYSKGIVAYTAGPWDAYTASRIRDGVLSGRYDKFNRLAGEEAAIAGRAIWTYVADVYGPSVIPNILYMTRVSRNAESGFLFVLGVSLKTLTEECRDHYKARFAAEDGERDEVKLEELPIRTRGTRVYSQFKLSPDGRQAAWVSNELGQYKVWLYDIAERKTERLIKGEQRLNRIVDRSFPVLAWHPSSRALSIAVERKGELYLKTYTLDDGKITTRPVFMLEKILSMAYSDDGQTIIFSAVREGRTDLYLYHVIGNRQEQLTDDQYDDLDPRFVDGGRSIIFSSDRTDDTLRANADVAPGNHAKDVFLFDLATRSPILTRLTSTPDANEVQPAAYDSTGYTCLSDVDGVMNRWLIRYDSAISHIDTAIHYRYFSRLQRATDLKRSILEQEMVPGRGRYAQLVFSNGRYHFHVGRTTEAEVGDAHGPDQPGPEPRESATGGAVTNDMSPVVKVDPEGPPAGGDVVDIRDYVFSDEVPGAPAKEEEHPADEVVQAVPAARDSVRAPLAFPQQRNYNVNFATDEVLTQIDNSYSDQFYQPFTGPASLNPGISGLMKMAASDLFEDHKIVGGFRLALDLNNNDYLLSYANLKSRMDKEVTFQRQALQGISDLGVVKLITHRVSYGLSWPFTELSSLRGTLMYRNDRYVVQSTDLLSLNYPDLHDQMAGARLEYVFDSSIPRGLNLYTGWKLKLFAEHYVDPEQFNHPQEVKTDMEVVGFDIRNSMTVHRNIIWVNRLAQSSSFGSRRLIYFLGGVDNWMFAKVDPSIPIDFDQNYWYQTLGSPMRGFYYNARNGSSFAVFNTELRVPVFRYLLNQPIRSDLIQNFQVVVFGDAGTAWTGWDPYSEDNTFNTQVVEQNPLTITIKNQREPVLAGYGFGLRSRLLGYFVRADWAWGVDDGVVLPAVFYFSLSLDI